MKWQINKKEGCKYMRLSKMMLHVIIINTILILLLLSLYIYVYISLSQLNSVQFMKSNQEYNKINYVYLLKLYPILLDPPPHSRALSLFYLL